MPKRLLNSHQCTEEGYYIEVCAMYSFAKPDPTKSNESDESESDQELSDSSDSE